MEPYEDIPIVDFDELVAEKRFFEGPFKSGFGDGYGDPYMPDRRVYGTLLDGRHVQSIKVYSKE